jgi:hypothetical protein
MDQIAERFDDELIDRLTTALTEHLGPEGCIVVAKAAREALAVHQLCMSLASHVPTAHRALFLKSVADLVEPAVLGPDTLKRAAQRLAEHIGPLAPVLVDKESRTALNAADLYARLAKHIRDPEARKAFTTDISR